jgi:CheY-like chemotaxis protein
MPRQPHILWVDDEIDLFEPHVRFLNDKGYRVTTVTNGADAVDRVRETRFDLLFLDEQMPGLDGLETLEKLKDESPEVPVVMVTKSEEEGLMEDALGSQISDYLTKPVNPSQILLTCKRLLERERIRGEKVSQEYLQAFQRITRAINEPLDYMEWVDIYRELVKYTLELEDDEGVQQILTDQYREANGAFGRFVEEMYPEWIANADDPDRAYDPLLSQDLMDEHVFSHLEQDDPVVFFVIDCMRYDQWLELEELLYPHYSIERDFYYSILPTATPYSRNSIFSGLLPAQIEEEYPQLWARGEEDEHSRNRHEADLLRDQLGREGLDQRVNYEKILTAKEGQSIATSSSDLLQFDLSAVVVNFVDILAHSRSDSDVLKQIAPDEKAYRALTRTWFEHSWLLDLFKRIAESDCKVVVTTDHGAVRSLNATKVIGDRETSTSLRYKYGRNLQCDEQHAIYVKDPRTFGLPRSGINTNYILAKEDYYFVYPTNYHHYERLYNDTLQHGGASMEEMILPVATLTPRR